MTYKETLFFIAKCLAVSCGDKNISGLEIQLKEKKIDWGKVVKISTQHYVLPAIYCNLERENLLKYLPSKLKFYMREIYKLNFERNLQIIKQANELNNLLISNGVNPVFLKGTANLLGNLYKDISERMIGDIDLICSKEEYSKAIDILYKNGYTNVVEKKYRIPEFMHHPRLIRGGDLVAIEIHKELLREQYADEFNYELVIKNIKKSKGYKLLNSKNQLIMSILSKQINDYGHYYNDISLRNAYDVFLILRSNKNYDLTNFSRFSKLKNPLDCFIATSQLLFEDSKFLRYHKTKKTEKYLSVFNNLMKNERKRRFRFKLKKIEIFIKIRLYILYKSIFEKEYRKWLLKTLFDREWYKKKLIQIGFYKNKY